MPLIKEQNAELVRHEAVVLDLGDLRRAAEKLTADAQAKARRIVADAEAEAARLTAGAAEAGRTQGLEEGRAEGMVQGRATGHAEALAASTERLEHLVAAWAQALEQWEADRRQMILDARQSLLELAVAIGEKVARRVPKVDPTIVVDQVAMAIDQMARPADATIRIHPNDRGIIADALPQLLDQAATLEHATLVDDEQITPGGCVVTFGRGRIDATLDTQLQRITEALLPDARSTQPEDQA